MFLIDTKSGEPSIGVVAQRPLTKGVIFRAPGNTAVTGDAKKSCGM
jgi:hypothetical protein